jgi:hypothetical protein
MAFLFVYFFLACFSWSGFGARAVAVAPGAAAMPAPPCALPASPAEGLAHRGGKGHGTAGSGGARRRWARGTSGYLRGRTPAPQGRRRQAPQDRRSRRRLTFFWGWAEIRRSRLWPLKVVLDELRVHAAQYKTRPSQAEHVTGRAGPAGSRGASQLQLLGTAGSSGLAGTAGSIAELQEAGGGAKCTNFRA